MTRKFNFLKYKKIKNFLRVFFFSFFELGKLLPEIRVSVSCNIRKFFFFLRKYKKVFTLGNRGFYFPEIKKSFFEKI